MKIVFIGTPDFAVPSLKAIHESDHELVGVITAPDRKSGRGMKLQASAVKEYALKTGVPILQPKNLKNSDFQDELRALNADIQVVIAFRMLPEAVWNMPPKGTINLHASLLPDYRGAAPINWAIINGEKHSGLTTFQLVHEIDKGNILLQKLITIMENDNVGDLHDKMMIEGADLVLATLDGLENGSLSPRVQDELRDYHHAPKIFKEDCIIDWNNDARAIYNLIRGLSPYPAARTHIPNPDKEGELVLKVFKSSIEMDKRAKAVGSIDTDGEKYLRFACLDGWIRVLEVQLEGRKRMKIEDFLRGFEFSQSK